MAYDGKLLARATEALKRRAAAHEAELNARTQLIVERCPRIGKINMDMRRTVIAVINSALSSGKNMDACLKLAQAENQMLRAERADLLTQMGYPPTYLDRDALCPLCGDTGYTEAGMCTCLQTLYREELCNALASSCGRAPIRLDEVDLSVYADERLPGERTTVQETMQYNLHICKNFAADPASRHSLFFSGAPGTGKSHLAIATAFSLCDAGTYVVYVSAGVLFACYEDDRFRRLEEARAEIRRWENCDVLIIDDLGTENTSSQNAPTLYQLLNLRQNAGRPTILCAGFGHEELSRRYGAPTASRVNGDFTTLYFRGADLRTRKSRIF